MKRLICSIIVAYGLLTAVLVHGARSFGGTSSDHMQNTTTPNAKFKKTTPFSFVLWARFPGVGAFKYIVSYDNVGAGDHAGWALYLDSSSRPACYVSSGVGSTRVAGGNAAAPSTWLMYGCSYDGSGTVVRWQGGQKDPSATTTAFTPTYADTRGIAFGIFPDLSTCLCPTMTIAYFTFWDVLLTDAEFQAMAGSNAATSNLPGSSPLTIRPDHIQSFIPILGYSTEYDLVSSPTNLTVTGTSLASDNPPITLPFPGPRSKPQGNPF